jgi:hypothetical protein
MTGEKKQKMQGNGAPDTPSETSMLAVPKKTAADATQATMTAQTYRANKIIDLSIIASVMHKSRTGLEPKSSNNTF